MEDAFVINVISEEEMREMFLVHKASPIFDRVIDNFRSKKESSDRELYMLSMVLEKLICFVLRPSSDTDPLAIKTDPIYSRQALFRHLKFITRLIDGISVPFKSEIVKIEDVNNTSQYLSLFRLMHRLLYHIVRGNRLNQFRAEYGIANILEQTCELTGKPNDFYASDTLTGVFSGTFTRTRECYFRH